MRRDGHESEGCGVVSWGYCRRGPMRSACWVWIHNLGCRWSRWLDSYRGKLPWRGHSSRKSSSESLMETWISQRNSNLPANETCEWKIYRAIGQSGPSLQHGGAWTHRPAEPVGWRCWLAGWSCRATISCSRSYSQWVKCLQYSGRWAPGYCKCLASICAASTCVNSLQNNQTCKLKAFIRHPFGKRIRDTRFG